MHPSEKQGGVCDESRLQHLEDISWTTARPPDDAEQSQHSRGMALSPWRVSCPQQLRQRPSSDSRCSAGHTVQFHTPGPRQLMQEGWHAAQVGSGAWGSGPCSDRRESSSDRRQKGGKVKQHTSRHLGDGIETSQTRGVTYAAGECEAFITGLARQGTFIWTNGECVLDLYSGLEESGCSV